MVEGMKLFRREYRGQLWLEILLVKGINDTDEEISALKHIVDTINPDKIQLNTVVRPPARASAHPVSRSVLERICSLLGSNCEIIGCAEKNEFSSSTHVEADRVLALLRHRAMTMTELSSSLDASPGVIKRMLDELEDQDLIYSFEFDGRHFFEASKITV
jgi:wyosine [tRNA(Phe)-imidazoG37] synthetase (radical SAM superfamily)